MAYLKNTASQNVGFSQLSATTGLGVAGATVTVYVSKDGGAQATGGGTATSLGNGQYNYAPTQAETNSTVTSFLFVSAGNIPVEKTVVFEVAALLTSGTGANQIQVDGAGNAYANVNKWLAGTIPAPNVTGVPKVDLVDVLGTAPTAATAGVLDVNAKNINNVSAASVTTISAVLGTTQALTFDANNLPKVNVEDWHAVAVTTTVPLAASAYTTPPTVAAIATGIFQDTTASDFTTAGSFGKSVIGAFTSLGSSVFTVAALANAPTGGSAPTAAAIATAVWQDATAGDFTTANSVGKSLFNAFTANSSVFTTASLVNAPTGGSAPTTAQIATAVWQDLTSSADFSTAGSVGALLKADVNAPIASIPTNPYTGTPPTTAQIATAVWEDTTAGGDFGTAGSIGKLIATTGLTIAGISGVTFPATVASPTNITAGTITTVVNLTNAPTAGDFTATMKASLNAATPASVGSVTGDVAGKVLGGGSGVITAAGAWAKDSAGNAFTYVAPDNADIATILSDVNTLLTRLPSALTVTGGAVTVGTNNDKTGYAVSATGLNAVLVAGVTLPNAVRYIGAAVAGPCTGGGTATVTMDDFSGATAFVATIDGSGDRSGLTYS